MCGSRDNQLHIVIIQVRMIGALEQVCFWRGTAPSKGEMGREVISLITGMAGCHHESTWAQQGDGVVYLKCGESCF